MRECGGCAWCETFVCVWYEQEQLSELLRPDKSGVMLERINGTAIYLLHWDPERPRVYMEHKIRVLIRKLTDNGNSVITQEDNTNLYWLGDGSTIEDIESAMG